MRFSSNTSFFKAARLSARFATWIIWMPDRLYRAPPAVTSIPFSMQSSITAERKGEGRSSMWAFSTTSQAFTIRSMYSSRYRFSTASRSS